MWTLPSHCSPLNSHIAFTSMLCRSYFLPFNELSSSIKRQNYISSPQNVAQIISILWSPFVFFSCGCLKITTNWVTWNKINFIDFTVPESRSLKLSHWQDHSPPGVLLENSSLFLPVSGGFFVIRGLWQHRSNLSVFTWYSILPSLWICASMSLFLLRRTLMIRFKAHCNPVWPYLNLHLNYICREPTFRYGQIHRFQVDMILWETLFNQAHLIKVCLFPQKNYFLFCVTAELSINLFVIIILYHNLLCLPL